MKGTINNFILDKRYNKKQYVCCLAHEMHDKSRNKYVIKCTDDIKPSISNYKIHYTNTTRNYLKSVNHHPIYFYEIRESCQSVKNGILFLGNELVVQEFSWGWGKTRTRSIPDLMMTKKVKLDGPVYICSSKGYHAVVEELTHITFFYERLKDAQIIVSNENKYLESLISYLFPALNILVVSNNSIIQAKIIYATTKSPFGEFVHPVLIQSLNNYININEHTSNHTKNLIYISRVNSKKRHWSGEKELENYLSSNGVSVIYFENMSIDEQIKAIRNASVIIGRHGAGLVNICFGRGKAKVIELYNNEHYNACYINITSALSYEYSVIEYDKDSDSINNVIKELNTIINIEYK